MMDNFLGKIDKNIERFDDKKVIQSGIKFLQLSLENLFMVKHRYTKILFSQKYQAVETSKSSKIQIFWAFYCLQKRGSSNNC